MRLSRFGIYVYLRYVSKNCDDYLHSPYILSLQNLAGSPVGTSFFSGVQYVCFKSWLSQTTKAEENEKENFIWIFQSFRMSEGS